LLFVDFSRFLVVSFDCYGTLIDWERGILGALRPILQAHDRDLDDASLLELYAELEGDAERGQYQPYREILEGVVRGLGKRLKFTPTPSEAHSLPDSLPGWAPFDDTVPALRVLKRSYQLAVISNIDDDLFASSQRKLAVDFDFLITAQQARAYKPSLKIFGMAEERIGIPRDRWLHLAQSVYHDIVPAKSLGIPTVWVNRASARPGVGVATAVSASPDLEVPNLAALADVVGLKASSLLESRRT
jgi:2-haloacid dehalogenase